MCRRLSVTIMNQRPNPFQPIYDICNRGDSKAKLDALPDFPRYIDIELTNTCNFRCLMCPVGTSAMRRKRGMMSDDVFERLIAEMEPHKTPVRFIRWGEPMLHPRFLDYVRKANAIGSLTHLNTNGSLLTEAIMDELLSIPLDSIKFSFQGVDRKSYAEMRNTDFFDSLLETIRRLHTKRGEASRPFIHVSTTITYESAELVRHFRGAVREFADLVTVGRTVLEHIDPDAAKIGTEHIETLRRLKARETVVKQHPECPEVFDKLSLNWDGTVSACCADYDNMMLVGDLRTGSLNEIWRSQRMRRYRELLADMRHDELELCRTCFDYHGLQTPGLQGTD